MLAWAVRGCLVWQQLRLGLPGIIADKTEELRASFDPLAEFFEDCCIFAPYAEVEARALRDTYEAWAKENGARKLVGNRDWGQRLGAKGCERKLSRRGGTPVRSWLGIGLVIAMPAVGGVTPYVNVTDETDDRPFSYTVGTTKSFPTSKDTEIGHSSVSSVTPDDDDVDDLDLEDDNALF